MALENAEKLLTELGRLIGIPDLRFDENTNCCLVFDAKILVNLAYEHRHDRLVLFSYLGPAPARAQGPALGTLLEANFFWRGTDGATLSIEPGSRSSVLMKAVSLAGLGLAALQDEVEAFVNSSEAWMARLENGATEEAPSAAPLSRGFSAGMRV